MKSCDLHPHPHLNMLAEMYLLTGPELMIQYNQGKINTGKGKLLSKLTKSSEPRADKQCCSFEPFPYT